MPFGEDHQLLHDRFNSPVRVAASATLFWTKIRPFAAAPIYNFSSFEWATLKSIISEPLTSIQAHERTC